MAGIGDSWGTREELLHPRDSKGRFRSKWKMSPSVLEAALKVLSVFQPRTFQSDAQARQYTQNVAQKKPGRFGGGKGYARLQEDFFSSNEDLLDGNPDEPSTKKFVQMMDQSMIELPDDVILDSIVPPAAFGLTPDRLPELEEMTGDVIANRGYFSASIGTPLGGGNGNITMNLAVPKGTRMAVPGRNPNDPEMIFDRDQEFTVTKVKPDGRGGYIVSAVATPKTPGENPLPTTGHAGPGKPADREARIKALEDAATKREMGVQGESQLPGGQAAGGQPEVDGKVVPATPAATGDAAADRAARRAQILGRPAGPNATPEAQREAAAPEAPAVPATAVAPEAPAPQAPEANVPEPPPGATSVVTGEPSTSFRDAVSGANLESPSAGPRRREWNSAYQGVTSGKQQPVDMLRELESDIANNKEQQKTEVGRTDSTLAADIEKQEKLADLIQSHFQLGEPKQRTPRQEVRADLDAKATKAAKASLLRPGGGTDKRPDQKSAVEAATPGPLAKVAAKRKDTVAERTKALAEAPDKDATDDELNASQRERWSAEVGAEPAEMRDQDTAGNILLDETADLLRNGRVTRPKAVQRLREQARDDDTPEADYLRKVADAIEADESKPAKRVPLKKAAARAAPDVDAAEAKLAGRTDRNILTGLNGLSVGDLRALAEKWDVQPRGDDKKLKTKAVLAKELAAKWKATPSLQRKKEGAPEAPAPVKAAKVVAKKAAPAAASDVVTGLASAQSREEADGLLADLTLVQLKDVAKALQVAPERNKAGYRQSIVDATVGTRLADQAIRRIDLQSPAKKAIKAAAPETPKTGPAKVLDDIAAIPEVPVVLKKAAAKAAVAEAPAAPVKKTVSAARLKNGDRIWVRQNAEGLWGPTTVKRGSVAIEVTDIGRSGNVGHQRSYDVKGRDSDGNEIGPASVTGQNVFMRDLPSAPATKKAAAPAAPTPDVTPAAPTKAQAKKIAQAEAAVAQAQTPADPFKESTVKPAKITAKAVKAVQEKVEKTKGPAKLSVQDRVAARLMERMRPDVRQVILAEADPKDRAHLLDVAERVALEDKRVKKGGVDLDGLLSNAGIKAPQRGQERLDYDRIKGLLADNDRDGAKKLIKERLATSDSTLDVYRRNLDDPATSEASKQALSTLVTQELARGEWLRSVGGTLSEGTAPELQVDKRVIKAAIPADSPLGKLSAEDVRTAAEAQGIKLPEAATTKEQILAEVAMDMIRRRKAGLPDTELVPPVAKKAAKKAAPVKIDVRTILPEGDWQTDTLSEGPSDDRMLNLIQRGLDGESVMGLPRNSTPAALGRALASWNNSAGGPGVRVAMETIPAEGARRRLREALTPEERAISEQEVAEVDARRDALRAQAQRWEALADKLKATRRTSAKKATPAAVADVKADLTPTAPTPEAPAVAKKAVKAAKAAPAKKTPSQKQVAESLSDFNDDELGQITRSPAFKAAQKAIVSDELDRRIAAKKSAAPAVKAAAKTAAPAKKAVKAAKLTPDQARTALETVTTREDARELLSGMTAADLKKINPTAGTLSKNKADLIDLLVDGSVGGRLDRAAMTFTPVTAEGKAAKKAAEAAKAATPSAAPAVEARRVRNEVAAEVAAPAKKSAKKATAALPDGSQRYTKAELQDMNLGDLVQIEKERGIKRASLDRGDRVQAILDQQDVAPPAPVKKVAAKASKAAAEKIVAAPVSKAAPTKVGSSDIQTGKFSTKPALKNGWGTGAGEVNFHRDGEIGQALRRMGDDAALEVDGDRLDNVVGKMATDAVRGRVTQQELTDNVKKLADRLPAGSKAKTELGRAVKQMDTPARSIDVPEGTPAPLVKLAKDLSAIPLARTDRQGYEGSSELTRLEEILKEFQGGNISKFRLRMKIEELLNGRHESQEGKFQLDRVILEAVNALKASK